MRRNTNYTHHHRRNIHFFLFCSSPIPKKHLNRVKQFNNSRRRNKKWQFLNILSSCRLPYVENGKDVTKFIVQRFSLLIRSHTLFTCFWITVFLPKRFLFESSKKKKTTKFNFERTLWAQNMKDRSKDQFAYEQ